MQPVSCASCQALQRRLLELQAENHRLRRQLDEAASQRVASDCDRVLATLPRTVQVEATAVSDLNAYVDAFDVP